MRREPWDTGPYERTEPNVDAAGALLDEVGCIRCGYNLRGLAAEGVCPECGTAVGLSVRGDLLRYADPAWVERVATGASWYLAAIAIGFVGGILAGLIDGATNQPYASVALQLALLGINVYAVVLYTSPEPAALDAEEQGLTARKVARYLTLASVALSLLTVAVVLSLQDEVAGAVGGWIAGLLSLVAFFALLIYAERLARRVPDEALANSTRGLRWLLVVLIVLGFVSALALALLADNLGDGDLAVAVLGCGLMIAALVALIWGLVVLVKHRNAYLQAARDARHSWAGGVF